MVVWIFVVMYLSTLNLRHVRAASWTSHVDTARGSNCEEQGNHEAGPGEPEEGSGCLSLPASAGCVARAVSDVVGFSVVGIAAAVSTKLSRHGNCGAEVEENVEEVQGSRNKLVDGELFSEANSDEVEEREHAEYRYKHVVVDD